MKKVMTFLVFSVLTLVLPACMNVSAQMGVGDAAKSFSAETMDKEAVSFDSALGKSPVLLVFFATWCPPCREEVPHLINIQNKFSSDGLKLVAVSVDNSPIPVKGFISEKGINYTVWHDVSRAAATLYAIRGIPTNILIDSAGTIVYREHQPPSEAEIMKALKK
jgi:peroxiredoxin